MLNTNPRPAWNTIENPYSEESQTEFLNNLKYLQNLVEDFYRLNQDISAREVNKEIEELLKERFSFLKGLLFVEIFAWIAVHDIELCKEISIYGGLDDEFYEAMSYIKCNEKIEDINEELAVLASRNFYENFMSKALA